MAVKCFIASSLIGGWQAVKLKLPVTELFWLYTLREKLVGLGMLFDLSDGPLCDLHRVHSAPGTRQRECGL